MHHVMIIWYLLIQASTQTSRTSLMSTHASYRLAGERGGTRGAGGGIGAGTSGSVRARRGAAGVPGS